MPAVTAPIGISSLSAGVISKVRTSLKVKTLVKPQFDSSFGLAGSVDPTGEFSVDGWGDTSAALGVAGSNAPSTVTGGVILVDNLTLTDKDQDFNGFKYSGKWFPGAS